MRDYKGARELFKDVIDTSYYFDSMSAEIGKNKILEAIKEKNAPLIFVIADPGVGKSYILRLTNEYLKDKHLTVFIDHPFFDKRDLLKMLYNAKDLEFDPNISFNNLKNTLLKHYKDTNHTIFMDEAQLLNEEQFELIRILSDTKIFQFVLAMHKEEGLAILQKKHFKSRTKVVVELSSLKRNEIHRYIQNRLLSFGYADIATMFQKSHIKEIEKYTKGNFRLVKKLMYSLLGLLDFAKSNGLEKYQEPNNCLINMAAIDIGLVNE